MQQHPIQLIILFLAAKSLAPKTELFAHKIVCFYDALFCGRCFRLVYFACQSPVAFCGAQNCLCCHKLTLSDSRINLFLRSAICVCINLFAVKSGICRRQSAHDFTHAVQQIKRIAHFLPCIGRIIIFITVYYIESAAVGFINGSLQSFGF